MSEIVCENTDRELWRDNSRFDGPSIHVTKYGGIGIDVGGTVFVKPLRGWHALAKAAAAPAERLPRPSADPHEYSDEWLKKRAEVAAGLLDDIAPPTNPFSNRCAETMGAGEQPKFRRASGTCVCKACGHEYRWHAHTNHRDHNGDFFLNQLCNGELVKL